MKTKTATTADGLCENCDNVSDCASAGRNDRPVVHCEEYACAPAPRSASPRSTNVEAENRPIRVGGLCGNCENLSRCAIPRPLGGVWHCEEYL
jgi:hypothetical protein